MPALVDMAHVTTEVPADARDNESAKKAWLVWCAARRVAATAQGTRPVDGGVTAMLAMTRVAADLWPTLNWNDHREVAHLMEPVYNYLRSSGNAYTVTRKNGRGGACEWFLSDAWIVSSTATVKRTPSKINPPRRKKGAKKAHAVLASAPAALTSATSTLTPSRNERNMAGQTYASRQSVLRRALDVLGADAPPMFAKSVKTGDPQWPYACGVCHKPFESVHGVGSHYKAHTGDTVINVIEALLNRLEAEQSRANATVYSFAYDNPVTTTDGTSQSYSVSVPTAEMDVSKALEVLTEYVTRPQPLADTAETEAWRARAEAAESSLAQIAQTLHERPIGEAIVALMNLVPQPSSTGG